MDMNHGMKRLGAAMTPLAGRPSDDQSAGLDYREPFRHVAALLRGFCSRWGHNRGEVVWIYQIDHGVKDSSLRSE